MKISLFQLLAIHFVFSISIANAAIVENTITVETGQIFPSSAARSLQVPRFDTQLGTLLSARYNVTVYGIRTSSVEDLQVNWSGPITFQINDTLSGSVSIPGMSNPELFVYNLGTVLNVTAPYDGIEDFSGTSGTANDISIPTSYSGNFNDLSLVSGSGTFPITHTSQVAWNVRADSGNYYLVQRTYLNVRTTVTYTYETSPQGPTPGPGN